MSQMKSPSVPQGGPPKGPPAPVQAPKDAAETHALYLQALDQILKCPPMKLELDELHKVAEALDSPHTKFAAVHVAGTNGKGSVSTKVAACLMAKGYKVGLFVSPHLLSLRERFSINGLLISEGSFVTSFQRVQEAANALGVVLTFFECCTLLAFDYFALNEVDWAVVETGLGGRLDATNILLDPRCCIITSIGWDHMNVLGNSLELIAEEKAGILKKKAQVVLGPSAAPFAALWERAAALQCDVWDVKGDPRGEDFDKENNRIATMAAQNVLCLDLPPPELSAALAGRPALRAHWLSPQQLRAAAHLCSSSSSSSTAAAAAAEHAEAKVPLGVVIDVGHNETAIDRLMQVVGHEHYGAPVRVVVCLSKQRSSNVLVPILSQLSFPLNNRLKSLHLATADHPRGRDAAAVFEDICSEEKYKDDLRPAVEAGIRETLLLLSGVSYEETAQQTPEELVKHISKGTLPHLLRAAFAAAAAEGSVLVVCGSFFMMREVMQTLGLDEGPMDPVDTNEQSPTNP